MFSDSFSVAVVVSDAKRSAQWYREKLGFEVSTDDSHWITAWKKGADWKLHLCQEPPLEKGNTGICLYADDVEQTVNDLKSKGVSFAQDYTRTDWGGEVAKFEDPDGNIFWISDGSA